MINEMGMVNFLRMRKLKYIGNFINDLPNGTGSEFYSDMSKYTGFHILHNF